MRTLKFIFCLSFLSYTLTLSAQSEHLIFKEAAESLFNEFKVDKEKLLKERKGIIAKLPKEQEGAKVTILGMPQEQAKKLEADLEAIIDNANSGKANPPPPPPPPPSESEMLASIAPKKSDNKASEKISFSSTAMFPGQPKGHQYKDNKPRDPAAPKEKIEWVSSETITTTETIHIEDIKDPTERQKWEGQMAAYNNTFKLTRINFLEAIVKESQTSASFKTLLSDTKKGGFDFDPDLKKMRALEKSEQVAFIKGKILSMANKIASR